MSYLDTLNAPQREATITTEGPLMIIAGAGSGKTRVLTYRIAYLMEQGIEPFNILSLTFTNKAAKEMRHRIERVVGNEAKNLWMGTFHSVFAKILRFEAEKLGYTSNFTIYDTDDSLSLIRSIVKELQLDDKLYKANVVFNRISGAKNRLISWQEYNRNPIYAGEDREQLKPEMGRLYKTYAERCFKSNAMDFDDLLFNTNVLFRDHLDVLNKYQHKFRYVMVDEFQDTNLSQYLITRKLSAVHQNICVVGDDAQSIYSFRGADIQNILNFEKDYPNLKTVRLEQNYRSTKTIVNVANAVIANNKMQLRKEVWTENGVGEHIELVKAATDNDEGRLVATSIFEEKMRGGGQIHNADFAILYRTNSQSRSFEEALRKLNIKYKIVAGLSFYQRKEIKDLLAYLRFTLNQNDEEALKRIINTPKRGIGDTTISKIVVLANEKNVSLWEIIKNATTHLGAKTGKNIVDFAIMIQDFMVTVGKEDAYKTAVYIANKSGLLKDLFDDKTVEGRARYENVQELLNAIKEFVDNSDNDLKTIAVFLQDVALLTGADDKDEDQDKVTLMTIHASKGLEFKFVYVVGLEEYLFPSQMMIGDRNGLEEERRLFYVAITRAERKLFLTYALQRYRFGNLRLCEPSRFLDEVDQKYIRTMKPSNIREAISQQPQTMTNFAYKRTQAETPPNSTGLPRTPNVRGNYTGNSTNNPINNTNSNNNINKTTNNNPISQPLNPNFIPTDASKLKAGLTVLHQKFGKGRITRMDIEGIDKRAIVNFEQHGEKVLILSFAKLMVVE
jgi:DNA helicase-2/ATP-dependent DNA helicase PcrA